MTNTLDSIKDEYKLLFAIYDYLMQSIKNKTVIENKKITVTAAQFQTDKFKLEKGVYRLSQLGIVSDWIIEDFFKGKLQIEFDCIDADQLQVNLERTVRKYDPGFKLDDIYKSNNQYYQHLCEHRKVEMTPSLSSKFFLCGPTITLYITDANHLKRFTSSAVNWLRKKSMGLSSRIA